MREASNYLPAWRASVTRASYDAMRDAGVSPEDRPVFPAGTAVHVRIMFFMAPEQGALTGKPDIDKLVRAVFDPLTTSKVWADDSQVISVWAAQERVVGTILPGAIITVSDTQIVNSPNSRESAPVDRYRLTLTNLDAPEDDPADGALVEVVGTAPILRSILPAVDAALGGNDQPTDPAAPAGSAQGIRQETRRRRRTKAEMEAARAAGNGSASPASEQGDDTATGVAPVNTVATTAPYNLFAAQ
jgi:Holliday junction resolvase RusA-like endonuclease